MLYIDIKVGDLMDDIKYMGLTYQQVEERKQQGLINISHDNISKTKKQIVLEHTLTYFNCLNVFLAAIIISTVVGPI